MIAVLDVIVIALAGAAWREFFQTAYEIANAYKAEFNADHDIR